MWVYIYLETGCNSVAVMSCVLSVQLHFKDLELILWVQIKLYGPPCPSAAATARHICCSGIWSLSASWSETTSTPAAIYHRDKDRVRVFMWRRAKERERDGEGVGLHICVCARTWRQGMWGEETWRSDACGGFGGIFISNSHKAGLRAPHTMAPSKCPNSLAATTHRPCLGEPNLKLLIW